jgi:hypothetical protein
METVGWTLSFFLFHRQDWTRLMAIFSLFIIFCRARIIPPSHCFDKKDTYQTFLWHLFNTTFIFILALV